jgi:outer membrane protein OmpA-like peptidoglycan-associated protein
LSVASTNVCRAQVLDQIQVRASLAAATMISRDQLGRLGFDSLGWVGDVQLGYALTEWFDLRASVSGGLFGGNRDTGGLLAPLLGVAVGLPNDSVRPWVQLDAGLGVTGSLVRPLLRIGLGADLRLSSFLTLGPVIGYSQLFQTNGVGDSSDACFVWFGVSLGLRQASKRHVTQQTRWLTRERTLTRVVQKTEPIATEAPVSHVIPEPSPELLELIETALPSQRNEWLAPILFAFDSAELQPQGVAMLHEVATELQRRPSLRLLEIQGYADKRGDPEHNLKLSERRAGAVLEWLVSHGVARERLRVAAQGASHFVEPGDDEIEHQQNRRVIFRVIEPASP